MPTRVTLPIKRSLPLVHERQPIPKTQKTNDIHGLHIKSEIVSAGEEVTIKIEEIDDASPACNHGASEIDQCEAPYGPHLSHSTSNSSASSKQLTSQAETSYYAEIHSCKGSLKSNLNSIAHQDSKIPAMNNLFSELKYEEELEYEKVAQNSTVFEQATMPPFVLNKKQKRLGDDDQTGHRDDCENGDRTTTVENGDLNPTTNSRQSWKAALEWSRMIESCDSIECIQYQDDHNDEHNLEMEMCHQNGKSRKIVMMRVSFYWCGRCKCNMKNHGTFLLNETCPRYNPNSMRSIQAQKKEGARRKIAEMETAANVVIGPRHQEEDDTNFAAISDLNTKKKAIESDVRRAQEKINAPRRELQTITAQISSVSRVRKWDIDDAKRQAETFSKELDAVNKDPRRNENLTEIRKHEVTIAGLKLVIEEDTEVLQQLRRCTEEQNKIDILKTQSAQDVEILAEGLRDNSFLVQKYQLQVPDENILTNEDDHLNAIESLVTSAQDKHKQSQQDLGKSNDELGSIQKQVSEKSDLLSHNQRTIASLRDQIVRLNAEDRGVKNIERIVSMMRRFEIENLHARTSVDVNIHPQQLREHMTNMIGVFSILDDQPESIARTTKKLADLTTNKQNENGESIGIVCPLCSREIGPSDTEIFQNNVSRRLSDPEESLIMLSDILLAERNRTVVDNYERWRNAINQGMNDYLDNQRVTRDLQEKESVVQNEEKEVKELQSILEEAKLKASDCQMEVNDLRKLVDMTSRLSRVADKQSQIVGCKSQLTFLAPSSGGRDLRTVERNVNARGEEKENLMKTIAQLNKERSALNNRILTLTTQASNAEQLLANQKEQMCVSDQQASVKKVES